jgi:maltose alpha-D-glucosyltransferase/alpha-amylase
VLHEGYPFIFLRDGSHLVVVNPGREAAGIDVSEVRDAGAILNSGITLEGTVVRAGPFSYGIFELTGRD